LGWGEGGRDRVLLGREGGFECLIEVGREEGEFRVGERESRKERAGGRGRERETEKVRARSQTSERERAGGRGGEGGREREKMREREIQQMRGREGGRG